MAQARDVRGQFTTLIFSIFNKVDWHFEIVECKKLLFVNIFLDAFHVSYKCAEKNRSRKELRGPGNFLVHRHAGQKIGELDIWFGNRCPRKKWNE